MTIYHLYVKTHNVTGLKYLGKTESADPHKYRGSGTRWNRHLNKHGNDVTTQILLTTENKNELIETGLFFSELWNVVKSKEWANCRPESGDGFSSADASLLNRARLEAGTHNFLDGSSQKEMVMRQIERGTHYLSGPENNRKRVDEGTHNFLGGSIQTETNRKRVAQGTHQFLGVVPCVNINGIRINVSKVVYYNQSGDMSTREYVHMNTKEGKRRLLVPLME